MICQEARAPLAPGILEQVVRLLEIESHGRRCDGVGAALDRHVARRAQADRRAGDAVAGIARFARAGERAGGVLARRVGVAARRHLLALVDVGAGDTVAREPGLADAGERSGHVLAGGVDIAAQLRAPGDIGACLAVAGESRLARAGVSAGDAGARRVGVTRRHPWAHLSMSVQVLPSPVKPSLQAQVNEPAVFWQVALGSQLVVPGRTRRRRRMSCRRR